MKEIIFALKGDTKTCYRFEHKDGKDIQTLYLKKATLAELNINPAKGVKVTVEGI